jgi:DNA-directed RNA polymerase specialized sigma24 family protein
VTTATIERLHRKYAGVLYDKCVRLLRDRGEAEDAMRETFANAFRSLFPALMLYN